MGPEARDVALRMLERLFDRERRASYPSCASDTPSVPGEPSGPTLPLADFQREGVERVRAVLARRGGAVLADSVGLGKTYTALALIEERLRAGGDAVVVVPAAVRALWHRELRRLPVGGGGWRLLSHTQLARGVVVRPPPGGDSAAEGSGVRRLVVVDEAHRFRNPRTIRYGGLARLITRDVHALLITATPINNRPGDLLHLLRLFVDDDDFHDVGAPGLQDAFEAAAGGDDGRVAAVVRAVVVRRTRSMIRDRFDETPGGTSSPRFPIRAPPRLVHYSDPGLAGAVRVLAELELAPYALGLPSGASRGAASALIRLGLLKRLDSSMAAFAISLHRLERLLRQCLDAARVGRLLSPTDRRAGSRAEDGDPLQLTLVELLAAPAPAHLDLDSLVSSLGRDLERVRGLIPAHRPAPGAEPKTMTLRDLLHASRGDRTVVFTEYRDTAEALWRALAGSFRTGRVDGSGAWLGRQPAGRRTVVESFAPRSNGRRPPRERERVDVLISTDVLSEGVNLQDARHVVSYDLPWNPVRLLQRIGRVDRLGSLHSTITPHLFLPTEGLEEMLGLTRRIRAKLGHITRTVGAEEGDELLERLGAPRAAAADTGHDVEQLLRRVEDAGEDPLESLRTLWIRTREQRRERREASSQPAAAPSGFWAGSTPTATFAVPHDHPAAALRWIVLLESAGSPILLEIRPDGTIAELGTAGVAALRLAVRGAPAPAPVCTTLCIAAASPASRLPRQAIHAYVRRSLQPRATPPTLPLNDPGRRLARRIRGTMARAGAALHPAALERADGILTRLSTPLRPSARSRVAALLGWLEPGAPIEAVLREAEAALRPSREQRSGTDASRQPTLLLAALRIHPNPRPEAVDASRGWR